MEKLKARFTEEHIRRKEWKKHSLSRMKKHYWMMMFICLMMAMFSINYVSSLSTIQTNVFGGEEEQTTQVLADLLSGKEEEGKQITQEHLAGRADRDRKLGIISLEHTRGAVAELVNGVASGEVLTTLFEALRSVTNSEGKFTTVLFILISALFYFLVWTFLLNVLDVIFKREFLEARTYDRVSLKSTLFLIHVRKWGNAAKTILLKEVFFLLWCCTVVGGVIKSYSYMLVPYIVAENPAVPSREAITLSRKMMDGHKLEAFFLRLSFIPWKIVGAITWGLGGIFFTNPYMEAVLSEFYVSRRRDAIDRQIPGCEYLTDVYLYEIADEKLLQDTYPDAAQQLKAETEEGREDSEQERKRPFLLRFFRDWFGLILIFDESEKRYEKKMANEDRLRDFRLILQGQMYPRRLFPIHDQQKIHQMNSIHYDRHYDLTTLILMFFFMCFIGWIWEGSQSVIAGGTYVNRGILHGPWIPIYGAGSVLVLLLLSRFRKWPALEFLSAVILCGGLEYFTGWLLEVTHDGDKWWDYTGYFLNIDGRICAEGLLAFGIGGLLFVYLIAPILSIIIHRIPRPVVFVACAILLVWFGGDVVYSGKHPNTGNGITSVKLIQEGEEKNVEMGDAGSICTADCLYSAEISALV